MCMLIVKMTNLTRVFSPIQWNLDFSNPQCFDTPDSRFPSSVKYCNFTSDFSKSPIFRTNFRFLWRFEIGIPLYHHGEIDQSRSTDQIYNIIDWQILFTWLSKWLPLRLSKRQSPTTVLFRTTLTRKITLYELLILLGSNHLLCWVLLAQVWRWLSQQNPTCRNKLQHAPNMLRLIMLG